MDYKEHCEHCEDSGIIFSEEEGVIYDTCWFGEVKEYKDKTEEMRFRTSDFNYV